MDRRGLSVYQIRTHYIICRTLPALMQHKGIEWDIDDFSEFEKRSALAVSFQDYGRAMEFSNDADIDVIGQHALVGLKREGLLSDFGFASQEYVPELGGALPTDARWLTACLSVAGAELFILLKVKKPPAWATSIPPTTRTPWAQSKCRS